MTPVRVQRQRTKGWRMPENTVYVGRGSAWGNPYRVGKTQMRKPCIDGRDEWEEEGRADKRSGEQVPFYHGDGRVTWHEVRDATPAECVALYRSDLEEDLARGRRWFVDTDSGSEPFTLESLRGKNLACWCPLDQPCHADVLLELANRV